MISKSLRLHHKRKGNGLPFSFKGSFKMIKKYFLGLFLIFISPACKGNQVLSPIKTSFGTIYIKNTKSGKIKEECLIKQITSLLSDIDKGRIDPYRNKIFKEHSLVEAITKNAHIEVKRDGLHRDILIPIDKKSLKIVLYKNNEYALYGLYNKDFQLNLEKCIRIKL